MAYLVKMTSRAERDFVSLYEEIDGANSLTARNWYGRLKEVILSLEELPNRCPVIRAKGQLRHLLFGRGANVYRVIFRVVERQKLVEVLHIRHGARGGLKAGDLE